MIGEAPAPIAVVTDNRPCFRGATFADAFVGDDPNEHLHRATIGDGNAPAVEINLFRPQLQHSATHTAISVAFGGPAT